MSQAKPISRRRIIGRITSAQNRVRVQTSKLASTTSTPFISRAVQDMSPEDRALILPATSSS